MGNQLVAIAPQQIHPVEYYLNDYNTELEFNGSLGSTRFLKVAKVRHKLGSFLVAKVFAIHDPSLPLKYHQEKIEQLLETLRDSPTDLNYALEHNRQRGHQIRPGAHARRPDQINNNSGGRNVLLNVCCFTRVTINDKCALLLRQFIKYNLYDRLSTRPFLSLVEKKWIVFQIMKTVQAIHQRGICHGDLKLENVLVTSSSWTLLTDFATYKPVLLPEDNPADFSYFFDTSRRRCCNVAPERFVSGCGAQSEVFPPPGQTGISPGHGGAVLKPAHDLFSLGCIIAEIFSESNNSLFDLSQLLAYKAGHYDPNPILNTIQDENIRDLVRNLIHIDPDMRESTTQHLKQLQGIVFPSYFDNLHCYLQPLITLTPDYKIAKMAMSVQDLCAKIVAENPDGLLLLLINVTSQLRSLKHVHAKITALRLSCEIINQQPDTMSQYILDRLLPYFLYMLRDEDPRVRAEAITCINDALKLVQSLPPSDSNIFTDYLLPQMTPLINDRSTLVRITLASTIADLSSTALRFLASSCEINYESKLDDLQEQFHAMVSCLLTDRDLFVRRTLLSTNIAQLCVFFGQQKTHDVILSHIITYLNEKGDFMIRSAFFDNITSIASYLGSESEEILKPLLQQGLSDPEETVLYKTLITLASLIEMKLLSKPLVYQLIGEASGLLSHPNQWIKHAVLNLTYILATNLSPAQLQCKIMPLINAHLERPIHSIESPELILDALRKPLPRIMIDLMIHTPQSSLDALLQRLQERKMMRSLPRYHQLPAADAQSSLSVSPPHSGPDAKRSASSQNQLFERLKHEGLTPQIEEQILLIGDLLRRVNVHTKSNKPKVTNTGLVNLTYKDRHKKPRTHKITLLDKNTPTGYRIRFPGNGRSGASSTASGMNEEWLHMFGSVEGSTRGDISANSTEILSDDINADMFDSLNAIPVAHEAQETNRNPLLCPPCLNELNTLIAHKRSTYTSSNPVFLSLSSSTYRPKGLLIAHLHEHKGAVNQIVPISGTSLFATCSNDSYIKVWDAHRMWEGRNVANRSKQSFLASESQAVNRMTFCEGIDSLIATTNNNVFHILKVQDAHYSKLRLLQTVRVPEERPASGSITSDLLISDSTSMVTDLISISPYIFALSTVNSNIFLYDSRTTLSLPCIKLTLGPHEGLITSIDGNEYCLVAGTAAGWLVVNDIRFTVRSRDIRYNDRRRIRKVVFAPDHIFGSVQGNNEVSLWNCESGSRVKTLWASENPVLSEKSSPYSVLGMQVIKRNEGTLSGVITAGTDMRIRYWDLLAPERSYIISQNGHAKGHFHQSQQQQTSGTVAGMVTRQEVKYESKFIEGIHVIQEHSDIAGLLSPTSPMGSGPANPSTGQGMYQHRGSSSASNSPSSATSLFPYEQHYVSPAHRDAVTDVKLLPTFPNSQTSVLISADRSGVVKLWK